MKWEDPDALLTMKLSREEYCQRMLTSLILGQPYPKWNTFNEPSPEGITFLQRLHRKSHGKILGGSLNFVDEFDLPSINGEGPGGAPDYAILTSNTLWIIELKTESGSHRKEQLPYYAKLAAYHYPKHNIEILYLTGPMERHHEIQGADFPFRHLFWSEVIGFIDQTWANSQNEPERLLASALKREISNLHAPSKFFRENARVIRDAIITAKYVQKTGNQAGIEASSGGIEEMNILRVRIRDALVRKKDLKNVRPWIWKDSTSGGSPLTNLGKGVGYELRLSRYKQSLT
jgi:hypothetical protein